MTIKERLYKAALEKVVKTNRTQTTCDGCCVCASDGQELKHRVGCLIDKIERILAI